MGGRSVYHRWMNTWKYSCMMDGSIADGWMNRLKDQCMINE